MESLYTTYIMNQPLAIEHYYRLSQTFQFDVYFPWSQILAHKSSNAWDLPSLLIKPVQRLLHYPQLLASIVAQTPDSHSDKANLIEAHARIQQLARGLNARWREQKVVQVLASASAIGLPQMGQEAARANQGGLGVGLSASLAASVGLESIMSPRAGGLKATEESDAGADTEAVNAVQDKLQSYERFMVQFAQETVAWADAMRDVLGALNEWGQSFARVMWTDPDEECSDTFFAFLVLVEHRLVAAGNELMAEVQGRVLSTVTSLKDISVSVMRFLETTEPLLAAHYNPLDFNAQASGSYNAFRLRARTALCVASDISQAS